MGGRGAQLPLGWEGRGSHDRVSSIFSIMMGAAAAPFPYNQRRSTTINDGVDDLYFKFVFQLSIS